MDELVQDQFSSFSTLSIYQLYRCWYIYIYNMIWWWEERDVLCYLGVICIHIDPGGIVGVTARGARGHWLVRAASKALAQGNSRFKQNQNRFILTRFHSEYKLYQHRLGLERVFSNSRYVIRNSRLVDRLCERSSLGGRSFKFIQFFFVFYLFVFRNVRR